MNAVVLYTCPARTHGANAPVVKHPCGVAAQALDRSGHTYNVKVVGGFKSIPFSRRGKRDEIRVLTGQEDVPVLVLEDGTTVAGTSAIVSWAASNKSPRPLLPPSADWLERPSRNGLGSSGALVATGCYLSKSKSRGGCCSNHSRS